MTNPTSPPVARELFLKEGEGGVIIWSAPTHLSSSVGIEVNCWYVVFIEVLCN